MAYNFIIRRYTCSLEAFHCQKVYSSALFLLATNFAIYPNIGIRTLNSKFPIKVAFPVPRVPRTSKVFFCNVGIELSLGLVAD
jgi:hypothetical protein